MEARSVALEADALTTWASEAVTLIALTVHKQGFGSHPLKKKKVGR